jgi:hypothetical protein
MIDEPTRALQVVFVTDQKQFIQVFHKKGKSDYLLNVNKIMRDKFSHEIVVPNKIQAFLINYEIKKIIDKAINVRNRKYKRIVYVNSNLTTNTVLNTIDFLSGTYSDVQFEPILVDFEGEIAVPDRVKVIKFFNESEKN